MSQFDYSVPWVSDDGQYGLLFFVVVDPGFEPGEPFRFRVQLSYTQENGVGGSYTQEGSGTINAGGAALVYLGIPRPQVHIAGHVWTDDVTIDQQVMLTPAELADGYMK